MGKGQEVGMYRISEMVDLRLEGGKKEIWS